MANIIIDGNTPLNGDVTVSGAKNSAIKLIYASLFCNDDVILENVPRLESIFEDLELIRIMGGKAEWVGSNKLLLNGSEINTYEVPNDVGSRYRTSMLMAGPLLYRFGKATLPKILNTTFKASPTNRFFDTWKSLGIYIEETEYSYKLSSENMKAGDINFKTSTHMGTDNAIISSVFLEGKTIISNASEEVEIDDLVAFFKMAGVDISRVEPRKIVVNGCNIFKGGNLEVQSDKTEVVFFSTAAIVTNGDLIIKKIDRNAITPFINFLTKVEANYDLSETELRIWHNKEELKPVNLVISPSPGFVSDWKPMATLILNKAQGESIIHDTIYTNRFDYVKDLNRMGAKIELLKPSDVGFVPVISDDSYDYEKLGEPLSVEKISGPQKLKGNKITVIDHRYSTVLILAGLAAEGKTEIVDFRLRYFNFEKLIDKLVNLGAKIKEE